MSESIPTRPPVGRYGREPRERRWPAWAIPAAVIAVVAVPVGVWTGIGVLRDPVQWSTVGFSVTGDDNTDITLDVTRGAGVTVACAVHALNVAYAEVGVRDIVVEPSADRTVRVREPIPTAELATAAEVTSCWVVDPDAAP
ncbi:DUF4307 domain-containing protein [Cellulomonas timonensis]|uniref:DUF4307 domain-containing protein n=1 Tax=Cellulomonas timonensis TaxID=1689271 RepID=UPI000833A19B|nr:DUF4307 domain-containing protein [Cellulomonas timonensis]